MPCVRLDSHFIEKEVKTEKSMNLTKTKQARTMIQALYSNSQPHFVVENDTNKENSIGKGEEHLFWS